MDFIYRYSFEPTDCDTDGLCDGVPIRKHKGLDLDEVAIYKAQYDWEEHVAAENDEFLDALQQGIRDGDIESRNSGKRHLQAYIFKQMAAIDRPRALAAMNAWATFVNTGAGCAHETNFKTLDEYLHYRSTDVGYMFWHALIIFGCAITIPDHEINLCHQLALPAIMSVTLTNDIWSYSKEAAAAEKAGKPGDFVNALVVLQRQHNCSLQEAERLCRARNKIEVAKCLRVTKETRERNDVSQDLKDYLYHMLFGVSGNAIWSTQCRRYDMSAPFNERQQARLQQTKEQLSSSYDPVQAAKEATMKEATEIHRLPTPDSPSIEEFSVKAILDKNNQNDGEKPSEWTGGSETSEPTTSDHSIEDGHDDSSTASCSAEEAGPKSHTSISGNGTEWTVPQVAHAANKKEWSDACAQKLPPMNDDVVMEPYRYLCSLSSKGVRNKTIDALNFWLKVPADRVNTIKAITESLHGPSLMLDDIEDHSQLRRGKPSAHAVFGEAQTINSATFQYIQSVSQLNQLKSNKALGIFVDEIRQLFIGQAYELQWTSTMVCPSLEEYLQMVDGKTGGLFRLLMRLMAVESPVDDQVDFSRLCQLFGRYFQIRDDYANLKLADVSYTQYYNYLTADQLQQYTQQKGFCEDLDEGKFSLPLVIIFNEPTRSPKASAQLRNLLVQRSINKGMTFEQKILALELIQEAGGFLETEKVLHSLYNELELELQRLSDVFGVENHQLGLILEMLRVE
ncbi:polyprenyl synthetase [Fusarium sp. NRRL 52700]|nr:polyprenyl synthetase [Fusarium sp. NRRL 52700]